MTRLPNKPSKLIRLAIRDLRKVEEDPMYMVHMGAWHSPDPQCRVCLAGSVMAKSLRAPPSTNTGPEDFDASVSKKLWALDYFRTGDVFGGLDKMEIKTDWDRAASLLPMTMPVPGYRNDREEFINAMLNMANQLEEAHL